MVTAVRRPWRVVWVDAGGCARASTRTKLVLRLGFGWQVSQAEDGFGDGLNAILGLNVSLT